MELTHNEKEIPGILLKNRGRIVRRERIMRSLWNDESFFETNGFYYLLLGNKKRRIWNLLRHGYMKLKLPYLRQS